MENRRDGKPANLQQAPTQSRATSQSASISAQDSFQVTAPSISLPKGGGAIRGIGEKFAANPVTGTGSMSVPIATSPGRSGFGPQLSLSYDSGAGNGPFGLGWSLSLPAITRKTDKGLPRYLDHEESDVFILAGAEDLVPVLNDAGERPAPETVQVYGKSYEIRTYRPRIEGLFALIERWTEVGMPTNVFWRTLSRDNITTWYGKTAESRIADPEDQSRIFQWFICETHDDKGNVATYQYQREQSEVIADVVKTVVEESNRRDAQRMANCYLDRIRYGNTKPYLPTLPLNGAGWIGPNDVADQQWMFEVVFDYSDPTVTTTPTTESTNTSTWLVRKDPFSSHRAGFEIRTYRLCRRVLMFHHFEELGSGGYLVRSTDFEYDEPSVLKDPEKSGYTVLKSVTQRAYQKRDANDRDYESRDLPPVTFEYSKPTVDPTVHTIDSTQLVNLPVGTQGPGYRWLDLDGEGLSGVLTEQAGGWYYKPNRGDGQFGPLRQVVPQPAMAVAAGSRHQFMDLAGDGAIDVVDFSGPIPGFHERDQDEGWTRHVPFASLPNIDWQDANLRFVDLTGDGHADALITEQEVFTWYPSLDERGFAASERTRQAADEDDGPRLVFADGTQTIFLADMCGDGLTDLVRIRNGEVCYWPNLGYGRFGRKVTLDNSPRFETTDLFDPSRIRLTDIDGSGPVDIIYLGRQGAQLYFNRSGNSLSHPRIVALPVATENLDAVQVADLLGNGTACLVWNSHLPSDATRPVRYIDLMAGLRDSDEKKKEYRRHEKPHLLIEVKNNLGATTTIEYSPSTRFYLQDVQASRPWITRVPFPVHCVSKVTVEDKWRQTRFSSTYSYHHGYFDGTEREFRGFGRVEQVDVEDYGSFQQGNVGSPWITDDKTLYQPPIKTITWYHTGAALDRQRILKQFEGEYFPQRYAGRLAKQEDPFHERALPEPELPPDLTAEEWREALRACKGMILRQEVYELDVDDLTGVAPTHRPVRLFSAATHNCRIQRVQGQGKQNRHAVFLVTESEALTYHYELVIPKDTNDLTPDPRIAHSITLRHDAYGNPQQSVAIGYPRWKAGDFAGLPRPELIAAVQNEEHIAYSEIRYTSDVELPISMQPPDEPRPAIRHRRLRLPCETLTYELTLKGVRKNGARYFTPEDFGSLDLSDHYCHQRGETPPPKPVQFKHYHEHADGSVPQKRLVEHTRTLFFNAAADNASPDNETPLPFGQHGPRGLKYEDYKLALTDQLLAAVFQSRDPQTGNLLDDKLSWSIATGKTVRQRFVEPLDPAKPQYLVSGYMKGEGIESTLAGQYWMRSGVAGFADEPHKHFFLPERYTDPFGNKTELTYDTRDLFITRSQDAKGNVTALAEYRAADGTLKPRFDYRILAPVEMIDANGNHTEVAFDILGLPVLAAVKGKRVGSPARWEGDHLDGVTVEQCNPSRQAVSAFCRADRVDEQQARSWLGAATTRFIYHFGEWRDQANLAKAGACAITREIHVGQPGGATSPFQIALECSDGSGTVLMKKVQAEPDPALPAAQQKPRWIINGLTMLNNKGKPVKQYEPDFSERFGCERPQANGVTTVMYYDAPGRLVRTELPDKTFSRVEFSPWHVRTYDQNDTVKESRWYRERLTTVERGPRAMTGTPEEERKAAQASREEKRAARLAAFHADTPAETHLDSLGREVISIAHNRTPDANGNWQDDKYLTFTKLDAEGKPLWIRDARGNLVMQYINPPRANNAASEAMPANAVPCYDIAGNLLFQHSMDAGDRWTINDAAGKPMFAWDVYRPDDTDSANEEKRLYVSEYDALHRPTVLKLRINNNPAIVIELFEYQDAQANPTNNLNGQLVKHYDASGLIESEALDFKGNPLAVHRRLVNNPQSAVTDWQGQLDPKLSAEIFTQRTEYDALNRMTRLYNWHQGTGTRVAVYEPAYNERGLLASENLAIRANKTDTGYVENQQTRKAAAISSIRYNAKGQKTWLALGNGTVTHYTYDQETFRLIRLYTRRDGRFTEDCGAQPPRTSSPDTDNPPHSCGVQNLHYTYDAVGNITHIRDDAQQTIYFKNQVVEPSCDYTYDAIYRLIEATGREQAGVTESPRIPEERWPLRTIPTDDTLCRYTQRYEYDSVGNFKVFRHIDHTLGGNGSWARHYRIATDSNRLLQTRMHDDDWANPESTKDTHYRYDLHGSMRNLGATPVEFDLHWDHRDMIRHIDLGGGGQVWYQYASDKQRTRKFIQRNGGADEERTYLGGYERYRRTVSGNVVEEIESHHLFEGEQRLLLVDDVITAKVTGQPGPNGLTVKEQTLFRYQYGNHLGSVGVELDEAARVISYEEFHPYGTSAYRVMNAAVEAPAKRYRYTGMERDEESGLGYQVTRFISSQLAIWASCDEKLMNGGINLYRYGASNPIVNVDQQGTQPTPGPYRAPLYSDRTPEGEVLPGGVVEVPEITQKQAVFASESDDQPESSNQRKATSVPLKPKALEQDLADKRRQLAERKAHLMDEISRGSKPAGKEVWEAEDFSDTHVSATIDAIDWAIASARLDAQEGDIEANPRSILMSAQSYILGLRKEGGQRTTNSLILRDVDHYLAARVREAAHVPRTQSVTDSDDSKAALQEDFYDSAKIVGFIKQRLVGGAHPFAIDPTVDPSSAGGFEWVVLGRSHFQKHDIQNQLQAGLPVFDKEEVYSDYMNLLSKRFAQPSHHTLEGGG